MSLLLYKKRTHKINSTLNGLIQKVHNKVTCKYFLVHLTFSNNLWVNTSYLCKTKSYKSKTRIKKTGKYRIEFIKKGSQNLHFGSLTNFKLANLHQTRNDSEHLTEFSKLKALWPRLVQVE